MAHLDTVDGILLIELEDDEVRTRGAEVEGGRLSVTGRVMKCESKTQDQTHISISVF